MWQNFLALNDSVRREITREQWDVSQLSEADFSVLARLAAAPDESMRSTECARALDWETGRMSHQLRRMEERNLLRRGRGTADDGRAAVVTLTDEGRTAYRRALGPHWRSIKHWFLDGVEPEHLDQFDQTLQILLDRFQHLSTQGNPPKETS